MQVTGENLFKKYDRSGAYHHTLMSSDQFYIAKINKALSIVKPGEVVCDVGCGDGVFLKYAKEIGAKTFGIDTSAEGVRLAKMLSGCENLYVGSANDLPLAASSADLIIMIDVINYIRDYTGAIREAAKKLKPGGKLLIMSPANVDLEEEKNTIQDSWQQHACSAEGLRPIIEESMEIAEISFIKRPVLTDWVQFVVAILTRLGIIRLLRSILLIKKNKSNSANGNKKLNADPGGDIYLGYRNMPPALIKDYEMIEFMLVAVKR